MFKKIVRHSHLIYFNCSIIILLLCSLQARFTAYDSVNPSQRAQSELTIRVLRNQNGPIFNPTSYTITIADTYEVGRVALTVTATDADNVSYKYHLAAV